MAAEKEEDWWFAWNKPKKGGRCAGQRIKPVLILWRLKFLGFGRPFRVSWP
jgi:hypothetical protein